MFFKILTLFSAFVHCKLTFDGLNVGLILTVSKSICYFCIRLL